MMQHQNVVIFDASNLLHRAFYAYRDELDDLDGLKQLAFHNCIRLMHGHHRQLKATKLLMVFDRPNNWRKMYTSDNVASLTNVIYKGNRRKNLTDRDKEVYAKFIEFCVEFEDMINNHTAIQCFSKDGLEADDIISQLTQDLHQDNQVIIVSTDKDFIQLLQFPNVVLFDPKSKLPRYCKDVKFFMFEKNFRGDRGDNVRSAYPRIRLTKLQEAFDDDYKRLTLLNTTINIGDESFLVEDLFNDNNMMMNLLEQPECVQRKMIDSVAEGFSRNNAYSHFHFLRFCGMHNLHNLSDRLSNYVDMLNN